MPSEFQDYQTDFRSMRVDDDRNHHRENNANIDYDWHDVSILIANVYYVK